MKTSLKTNLLCILIIFVAWSCQQDELVEIEHSISGRLTAGENVTSSDFPDMEITLGKLNSDIDISNYDPENLKFDTIVYTPVSAAGTFLFENLEKGNYLAIMSDGFVFNTDTIWSCSIDANTATIELNRTVDRAVVENGTKTYKISVCKRLPYKIQTLYFYYDNKLYREIDASNLDYNYFFNSATIEIELDLGRNLTFNADILSGNSGHVYTTQVLPFNGRYYSLVETMDEYPTKIGINIDKFFRYSILIAGYFGGVYV